MRKPHTTHGGEKIGPSRSAGLSCRESSAGRVASHPGTSPAEVIWEGNCNSVACREKSPPPANSQSRRTRQHVPILLHQKQSICLSFLKQLCKRDGMWDVVNNALHDHPPKTVPAATGGPQNFQRVGEAGEGRALKGKGEGRALKVFSLLGGQGQTPPWRACPEPSCPIA